MNLENQVKAKHSWINERWRPVMGWSYIAICLFDFIIGPILNYIFFDKTGDTFVSWRPLTMIDGGMFHISMGVILGITSYTRGQEKMNQYNQSNYCDEEYESPKDRMRSYRNAAIFKRTN